MVIKREITEVTVGKQSAKSYASSVYLFYDSDGVCCDYVFSGLLV